MKKYILILIALLCFAFPIIAQEEGPSEEELAKANNPLADIKAFNIQYYFRPALNVVED